MRDYSKVAPTFWTGQTGRQIKEAGQEAVIVALYLMTSPHANMLGLYYCPLAYIANDTGLSLQGASKGLQRAIEANLCAYDAPSEVVWVYEMAGYQIEWQLKPGDKRVPGIAREYAKLPKCPFLGDFFDKYADAFHMDKRRGFEGASMPHRSQEQEQEQEQEERTCRVSAETATESAPVQSQKPDPIPYAEIISHLNERCGCQYKPTSQATRRMIKARWAEGFRLDDFKQVVDHKHAEWSQDGKMCAFLRPETLFSPKFESYLQVAKNGTAMPINGAPIPPEQDELLQKVKAARAERERKKAMLQGGQHAA